MNKFPPRLLLVVFCATVASSAGAQGLRLPGSGDVGSAPLTTPALPAAPAMPASPQSPRAPSAPSAPNAPALPAVTPLGSSGSQQTRDGIAAIVGNQVVTDYDLQLRMASLAQQLQAAGQPVPPVSQLRQAALNQAIDELALAQYAEATGLSVSQDTIDRALAQVAANNKMTVPELRKAVESEGMDWTSYQEQIRREILIARLRERVMAQVPPISSAQIDEFLAREDSPAATQPVQYDIAQIFLPLPENATPQQVQAVRARMQAIEDQLKKGADFAQLAKTESQGEGAKHGGDLGMRPASDYPTLFVDTVRNLKPGQISGIIRSPAGLHILKLLAVSGEAAPNEAMQSEVREIVLRADNAAARQRARAELDAVRDAVMAGKVDFAAKARELSQDAASAKKGGDIGWVLPGQLDPALDAALQRLNPGEVSAPIVLGDKVVLLQLVDRAMRPLAPEQKRALAREILQRRKAAQDFDELVRTVRAQTYVHIPEND